MHAHCLVPARLLSATVGLLALSLIPLYTNCLAVTLSRGNMEMPIEDYEDVYALLSSSFASVDWLVSVLLTIRSSID